MEAKKLERIYDNMDIVVANNKEIMSYSIKVSDTHPNFYKIECLLQGTHQQYVATFTVIEDYVQFMSSPIDISMWIVDRIKGVVMLSE
jgi:hypothetical protein